MKMKNSSENIRVSALQTEFNPSKRKMGMIKLGHTPYFGSFEKTESFSRDTGRNLEPASCDHPPGTTYQTH